LLRQCPAEGMECIGVTICFEPTFSEKIKNAKGISVPFQTDWLCRTLAKIAHSYSVLEHGVEKFEPFLIDIILGTDHSHYSYYIGNLVSTEGITSELHTLSYEWIDDLLVVYVRLYSRYGGPTYAVVAGWR
jgi:hypothetical protein